MLYFKKITDCSVETFKDNICMNTKPLIRSLARAKTGTYTALYKNLINIKEVDELPSWGDTIYIHFYGLILNIFGKSFIFGIFITDFIYTLVLFAIAFFIDEYLIIKIIAILLWGFVMISKIESIRTLYKIVDEALNSSMNC